MHVFSSGLVKGHGTFPVWCAGSTSVVSQLCGVVGLGAAHGHLQKSGHTHTHKSCDTCGQRSHHSVVARKRQIYKHKLLVRLLLGRPRECPRNKPRLSPYVTQWKASLSPGQSRGRRVAEEDHVLRVYVQFLLANSVVACSYHLDWIMANTLCMGQCSSFQRAVAHHRNHHILDSF